MTTGETRFAGIEGSTSARDFDLPAIRGAGSGEGGLND
jgi:hypothetical protein